MVAHVIFVYLSQVCSEPFSIFLVLLVSAKIWFEF